MNLIQAHDLETVKRYYIDVISNTPEIEKYARWVYGRHPTDEGLRAYIEKGEMYLLEDRGTVAGMVAIVMHQGPDYEAVSWNEKLENDQVATLHLLAVRPEYRGRGLGSRILTLAGELAGQQEKKPSVLMCWSPICLRDACTKKPDMDAWESSAGMLKTPGG